MKNKVEEKAIAFVRELQEELTSSNHSGFYIINEILGVAHKSFMRGYNEATHWRDPKEELPKDEQVLVKTDKDEILLVTYWVEKGDFVYWDAPVYNVIGWRPIE